MFRQHSVNAKLRWFACFRSRDNDDSFVGTSLAIRRTTTASSTYAYTYKDEFTPWQKNRKQKNRSQSEFALVINSIFCKQKAETIDY